MRGRLAPTPTGFLHLGHAATFSLAWKRARGIGGRLVLRIEDLDPARCRAEFVTAAIEDLQWLGLDWDEGPGCLGEEPDDESTQGAFGPYEQRHRMSLYLDAWRKLQQGGWIFPCARSRKDMRDAPTAPHSNEQIYPVAWRPATGSWTVQEQPGETHWRFRVPDGQRIVFVDGRCGEFAAVAGRDFGDFPVWRRDGVPSYELAVVVDDAAMCISEVVRGEDLLLSTCRQLLLYEALQLPVPEFYHCPLRTDEQGNRLAKRSASLSLRAMREAGISADEIREAGLRFDQPIGMRRVS